MKTINPLMDMVDDVKPKIKLPKNDRLISEFVKDVSVELKSKNMLFYRTDSKEIVEVQKIRHNKANDKFFVGFECINPDKFITILEKYIVPGYYVYNKDGDCTFISKSINSQLAKITLESSEFRKELCPIDRIFTVPIPIIHNGCLTFPKKGYDARFNSWMNLNAPSIDENMSIEEAKQIIDKIYEEFCFKSEQDKINAIAGLITPALRGLYSDFNIRTPIFFYIANRERCGKDYCAGITGIVYEGINLEEPAMCDGQSNNNSEEFRKKILSAFIAGRKRFHSANNKGFVNVASFEAVTTSRFHSDRMLGKNELLTFSNEIDFSMSGNMGITYSPDLGNRCRFIRFFLEQEDANAREFKNPDLHGWILENREKILSAIFTLVKDWFDKDMKKGTLFFASFPEWAKICGGIMENAGYGNPCVPDNEMTFGGDEETTEMKALFELCHANFGEKYVTVGEIRCLAMTNELFQDMLQKTDNVVRFGLKITKFTGRILSDIKLVAKTKWDKGSNRQVRFMKVA